MSSFSHDHLLLLLPFPEPGTMVERLQRDYPNLRITVRRLPGLAWNYDQVEDEIYHDVTMLATMSALPSSVDQAPRLSAVQVFTAGTNHLEKSPIFQDPKITFMNGAGLSAIQIAEWVIMMILVKARHYDKIDEFQKSSKWATTGEQMAMSLTANDSHGKRIGIIGYGSIGRQVARLTKALGMDIVVYTASKKEDAESRKCTGWIVPGTGDPDGILPSAWFNGEDKASLHHFLKQDLDFVIMSLPLTPKTKGMLGKEEFEILGQRKAFVLNVSRGDVIVQDDLIEALWEYKNSDGKAGLRGAAVDVVSPEPLPQESSLWSAPNIIISPHLSAITAEISGRAYELLEDNVRNHLQKKALFNVVKR